MVLVMVLDFSKIAFSNSFKSVVVFKQQILSGKLECTKDKHAFSVGAVFHVTWQCRNKDSDCLALCLSETTLLMIFSNLKPSCSFTFTYCMTDLSLKLLHCQMLLFVFE